MTIIKNCIYTSLKDKLKVIFKLLNCLEMKLKIEILKILKKILKIEE